MSFGEWAADRVKKSSSYDPKDHGTRYYRKEDYDKYNAFKKKSPLDEIVECRDILRSAYASRPSYAYIEKVLTHALAEITNSYAYIEKVLTHALAEITNMEKKIQRLEKDLEEANKDIIKIQIGDETVVIDGDLATHVISSGVKNYIIEALSDTYESKD